MNIKEIINGIEKNDAEASKDSVELIFKNYKHLRRKDIEDLAPSLVYYLWKLPKFSVQKEFVSRLLENTDRVMRQELLMHLIKEWSKIQLVRTDKFYYLIRKIIEYYPLNMETIPCLFNMTDNVKLRAFIIRCVVGGLANMNEEIEDFLVKFISACSSALLFSFKHLKFKKDIVLKYARSKKVENRNRQALYSMIQ